ncbi:HAD-IIA family hydrolase [Sphingomonas sp. MMS24-J13]|uniref:HAD-IIA family hydrolase n=1 Tax=Sphingomonas sp. MMS24-J13 TaxID=3238686 RepID=UPI00384BE0A2
MTDLDLKARLAATRGVILDMDGTLVLGDHASGGHVALPGAIDLIAHIRAKGIPFRIFTNGSAKSPRTYAASLRRAGFELADEEFMTPTTVAASWFLQKGIKRVRVLGDPGVEVPLQEAGLETIAGDDPTGDVEAVYSAWFRSFTFPALELACRDIWAGAILATASHVPFFAAAGGRAIGSSFAINAMLKAMTGKKATIVGKPSLVAFQQSLRLMGLKKADAPHVIVVGDDSALESRMANAASAISVGVATGLNPLDFWHALPPRDRPLLALEKAAELIPML